MNGTDGENPYATPQTEPAAETPTGRSFGWQIVDGRLWVKSSVMFPKIDLYSGSTSGRMVKRKLMLRYSPRWLRIIPAAGALVGALFFANMRLDAELVISGVIGNLLGLALAGAIGMIFPAVTVHCYENTSGTTFRSSILMADNLLFTGMCFGFIVISDRILSYMPLILLAWVALMIVRHFVVRKLSCTSRAGDRYEIRGLHSKAVEALEQMQNGRP